MVLLHLENVFDQFARGRNAVPQPAHNLSIGLDCNSPGNEILLDHPSEAGAFGVLGMAAGEKSFGVEIGSAAQVRYARRDPIRMLLYLTGVFQELLLGSFRIDTSGHVVLPFVTQDTHALCGEDVVQDVKHRSPSGPIILRNRTLLHMLARMVSDFREIRLRIRSFEALLSL